MTLQEITSHRQCHRTGDRLLHVSLNPTPVTVNLNLQTCQEMLLSCFLHCSLCCSERVTDCGIHELNAAVDTFDNGEDGLRLVQ